MDKFSINNINDFKILEKAVIGFEFEFYSEKSYYKLLEFLNNELEGIKVRGFRKYHSKFNPGDKIFKIEPDYSLGKRGVELITGPIPYVNSKVILLKIIQDFGRTNEKASLHINISFDPDKTNKTIDLLNKLKILLDVDEEKIYKSFPERRDNYYAKSVKNMIPFKGYDFSNDNIIRLTNNLELPDTKYYGINTNPINEGRLEFRYVGGEGYEDKTVEILDLLDYFILITWNSINEPLSKQNITDLRKYLNNNISNYKNFKNYENFIGEFPTIKLQVDKETHPDKIRLYYDTFYDELFEILNNIYSLQDCILNWNTDTKKFEIVDADFKAIFDFKNLDLVECTIDGGSYYGCNIVNCDFKNSHIYTCNVSNSDIFNSKIEASKIDETSELNNCYLFNTQLNGILNSGVFRSGRIGENAIIGDDVEIISGTESFFGVKHEDGDKKKKYKNKDWNSLK
jgi:hypothetical protein